MLNRINLQGRLTRDPELRATGSGVSVANFRLAIDRDFPPKDGGEREADFVDCVAWRQTGEFIARNFVKGQMMVVDGRLGIKDWTDKNGEKHHSAEVTVANAYFCGTKPGASSPAPSSQYAAPQYTQPTAEEFALLDGEDEQLPF